MSKAEPNVVPLCDVLLVLLIIFMVITPVVQKGIDVKLPETSSEAGANPNVVVLTIHNNMKVDINNTFYEFNLVQDELIRLFASRHEKTLLIRADARVPYEKVVEAMDMARAAGVETLGLVPDYFEEADMRP
ncbi:MAG: biopolymer transporter ExbD [Candidatus Aminicenantes bacterium]|nr:biopolymer transporter ExbD [Candidatus Aminicenantes bacterium]